MHQYKSLMHVEYNHYCRVSLLSTTIPAGFLCRVQPFLQGFFVTYNHYWRVSLLSNHPAGFICQVQPLLQGFFVEYYHYCRAFFVERYLYYRVFYEMSLFLKVLLCGAPPLLQPSLYMYSTHHKQGLFVKYHQCLGSSLLCTTLTATVALDKEDPTVKVALDEVDPTVKVALNLFITHGGCYPEMIGLSCQK